MISRFEHLSAAKFSIILLVLIIGICLFNFRPAQPLKAAGPFPDPIQKNLRQPVELPAPDGFQIWGMKSYYFEGMVIRQKRYRWDMEAKLSPVDFILGWDSATVEPNLNNIKWWQRGRWYFFQYKNDKVDVPIIAISRSSANTHILYDPNDQELEDLILSVKDGDTLRLKGYLVEVEGPNGYRWRSSFSRNDTGDYSCEVFYVTELDFIISN